MVIYSVRSGLRVRNSGCEMGLGIRLGLLGLGLG